MSAKERLQELVYAVHNNYYFGNKLCDTILSLSAKLRALEILVIEEFDKPKYACPNCHRVVDELFTDEHKGGFEIVCCQHCGRDK